MMSEMIPRLRALCETVVLRNRWLFLAFIVVNVVGFVWGTVGWYGTQLPQTPLIWWLFVPDCPLVSLLFAIAIWGLRSGRRWPIFNLWAAMGLIKYGVWTCTVWLAYWSQTGDFHFLSLAMFATHVGLIAQGVVLLLLTRHWTMRQALPVLAYYIVADLVDYGLGHHPGYPRVVSAALVQWHSVAMTALLGSGLIALGARMGLPAQRPEPLRPIKVAK